MVEEVIKYPEEFKIRLVRQIEAGIISIEGARRKYQIGGSTTISKWRKKYGNYSSRSLRITKSMSKKVTVNPIEERLLQAERELALYKRLIEVSDYFRDPAVKKKIAQRLSDFLAKNPEEIHQTDIPYLKSVLYSVSADKPSTNTNHDAKKDLSKKNKSSKK